MSKRKLASCGIVLLVALVLLTAIGHFFWTRGVYVSITNNTQDTLKHMNIVYRSGVIHIAELEPKTSCGRYVNPTCESDLTLEWLDSSGAKHSHGVDTYLDPNYAGSVKITLKPDNKISVTQKVRVGLIWRGPGERTYSLQGDTNGIR
jgi:hypothetical protein